MSPASILIADDEEAFRSSLEKILARRGYRVTLAADGANALRMVLRGGIDVAILDIKMPGLDGISTLREIKRIQPDLHVIILTGHLLKSTEQEGLALGAAAYLTKPCTVADLIGTIERIMTGETGERSSASSDP
jgi:two-component system NtrC family response regulator